jgi:ribosomal protein S18 acetylase RimI-like enzyme
MHVQIRHAVSDDIPGIKSVLATTWRDTYSSFLAEESITKVTAEWHSAEVLQAEIDRPSTLLGVATIDGGRIIGLITAHSNGPQLLVSRLYVLPEFQRQGIGEGMMERAYHAFPQTRRVRLEVEEQNRKGRAFYAKLGFRQIGVELADVGGVRLRSVVMERAIGEAI